MILQTKNGHIFATNNWFNGKYSSVSNIVFPLTEFLRQTGGMVVKFRNFHTVRLIKKMISRNFC